MLGKKYIKFSAYFIIASFILGFFISIYEPTEIAKAEGCGGKYASDLQSAINDTLTQNPTVGPANNCSTESVTTLLNGTVILLRDRGFTAGRVFRAGVNGLSDDKILVAKTGDTEGEMYDVINSVGVSTKTIGASIVLNCAATAPLSEFKELGSTPAIACDEAVGPPTDPTNPTNPTSPTEDDSVIPPDLTSDGVNALAGKNPSLAFNPEKRLWLVVAENNGKIQGQFMTEKNKTSGSVINIGNNGKTPKIAYGATSNTFLVVWTSGKNLVGQLISSAGTLSGSPIQIGAGGAKLYAQTTLQYDSGNQRFVLAYEREGAGVDVVAVIIKSDGATTGPVELAHGITGSESEPTITVNRKTNSYCASYVDGDKLKVQSLSVDGIAGTPSEIAKAERNVGIGYSAVNSEYLAIWQQTDGKLYSKNLATCANNPDTDEDSLSIETTKAVISNSSNTFGLIYLNNTRDEDKFITLDSSGTALSSANQTVFSGKLNPETFWPAIAPNSLTGQYAAATSIDGTTVKFTAGVGIPDSNLPNSGNIPNSVNLSIPDEGLPTDLGQLIEAIFNWALTIIGFVIFIRFFYAGFLWFTAAGNTATISNARNIMWNAVYGTIILFSAYLILNTINPDLVKNTFNLQGVPASEQRGTSSTSCLSNGSSSYSSKLSEFQNRILDEQPAFNTASNTPENREQFTKILMETLTSEGYTAGKVSSCNGTGTIPVAIMIGFNNKDRQGDVCTIFDTTSSNIKDALKVICAQRADWKQLSR